jgi:hypothetical protein
MIEHKALPARAARLLACPSASENFVLIEMLNPPPIPDGQGLIMRLRTHQAGSGSLVDILSVLKYRFQY